MELDIKEEKKYKKQQNKLQNKQINYYNIILMKLIKIKIIYFVYRL